MVISSIFTKLMVTHLELRSKPGTWAKRDARKGSTTRGFMSDTYKRVK